MRAFLVVLALIFATALSVPSAANGAGVHITNSGTSVNVSTSASASSGGTTSDGEDGEDGESGGASASVTTKVEADNEGADILVETTTEHNGTVETTSESWNVPAGQPVEVRANTSVDADEATTEVSEGTENTLPDRETTGWISNVVDFVDTLFRFFSWSF